MDILITRMELELAELKLSEMIQELDLQLQEINREVDFDKDINYIIALLNYSYIDMEDEIPLALLCVHKNKMK